MHSLRSRAHHHFAHHPVGGGIWLASVLRFLGESMILIFLLIYLFDLGFSPLAIFGYGVVFNLAALLLNHWLIGPMVAAFGPRKMIAVSNLALIAFVLGLAFLPPNLIYLYLLAGLKALSLESYALSQHIYLVATAAKTKTGKKVGRQFSAAPLGCMLGPLLGGLIAWVWSPQITSLVAGAVLIASGSLAFVVHDQKVKTRQHYVHAKIWGIYRRLLANWRNPLMVAGSVSLGFADAAFVLYAGVFLLAAAESNSGYGLLGIFNFVGSLVGLWIISLVGRAADKGQERRMLRWSVVGESILGAAKLAISLVSQAVGLILFGFVILFCWLPYEQREIPVYRRAYKLSSQFADSKVEYTVCLENIGAACLLVLFSLACLASLFLSFETTLLAAISTIFLINLIFLLPPGRAKA